MQQQEEIHLLFMMSYLPPGLFNRLRVRCCSPGINYFNWKDHLRLLMDDHWVDVWNDKHPPGTEESSPSIHIKGRGPKGFTKQLWQFLLQVVQVSNVIIIIIIIIIIIKKTGKKIAGDSTQGTQKRKTTYYNFGLKCRLATSRLRNARRDKESEGRSPESSDEVAKRERRSPVGPPNFLNYLAETGFEKV